MKRFNVSRWHACAWASVLIAAGLLTSDPVAAQAGADREALRRLQAQLQRVQQEKAALERERAELQARLASAQAADKELAAARVQLQSARREAKAAGRIPELEAELSVANQVRARQAKELDAANARLADQQRLLDESAVRGNQLAERLKSIDAALLFEQAQLQRCTASNRQLAATGRDILDRLADGSCRTRTSWEPLLQFGRVRFENELEALRDTIAGQQFQRESTPAPQSPQ